MRFGNRFPVLLTLLFLLLIMVLPAFAQRSGPGLFQGASKCADVTGPGANYSTFCLDYSTGSLWVWSNTVSTWVQITSQPGSSSSGTSGPCFLDGGCWGLTGISNVHAIGVGVPAGAGGTITGGDGAVWGSTGFNALGIGVAAPSGGAPTYLSISSANSGGTYALLTNTLATGTGTWAINGDIGSHYGELQYINSAVVAAGSLQPDSTRLLSSGPNGLQIEADESTGTSAHAPIGLWSNNTEVAWFTSNPNDAGALVLPLFMPFAYAMVSFGDGGYIGSAQLAAGTGHNAYLSTGEYYNSNTSQWMASDTKSAIVAIGNQSNPPQFVYYSQTGMTVGSPAAANTEIGALSITGTYSLGMFQTGQNPTVNPAFDNSGSPQVAITTGTHVEVCPSTSGLVIITGTNGYWGTAIYLLGSSQAILVGQSGGYAYISNSTTPAAGQVSMAFDGAQYAIYNNTGTTYQWDVMCLRTRAAD